MPKQKFQGIIPPVPTIINETGELDQKGMGSLIDYLIDSGVHGLFFLGSGGEFSQMSVEERKNTAEFATGYVNRRVPVFIGTGSSSTREAITLSQHSEDIGADGVVVINPYYWPLSEENLYSHYGEIAKSVSLPILLYNFPALTGQDLSPDIVLKLVNDNSNIIGIKETVDEFEHIREMVLEVKKVHPHFSVFCGFDDQLYNTLSQGGDGAIPASCNFALELTIGIYEAFTNKNYQEAISFHQRLAYLPSLYKLDSPFVNVIKEAIKLRGIDISCHVLPPARKLESRKKRILEDTLKKASII